MSTTKSTPRKEKLLVDIIRYLVTIIQQLYKSYGWLLNFVCRYIPLRQWAFDDTHSPKYQKFTVDVPPLIIPFEKQDWEFLIKYYEWRYKKPFKPVRRRNGKSVPESVVCPVCGAPHEYIYDNTGGRGEYKCKVCGKTFVTGAYTGKPLTLKCPYCGHALVAKKSRKFFRIHKCVNPKCSFYLHNLSKVGPEHLEEDHGKWRYKLHYIYREFTVDFFSMDLSSLPANASSLKFRDFNTHIMGLCLTMHVNLGLSLRKTARALDDLYGIHISHQQVANYARTAALCIKPFVDHYPYEKSNTFVGDETYIKVRGVKSFLWLIIDAVSRSIIGYQVSDDRSVGPCILAMRMAFRGIRKLPEKFRFVADGYSAYVLAAQQFGIRYGSGFRFKITQVIGLTNDDAVSTEFRPFKQLIERLNRTYKETYRVKCGYDNYDGANYNVALWVAYYNFLRPHKAKSYKVLNEVDGLSAAGNMPGKWELLIFLGQQTILNLQNQTAAS